MFSILNRISTLAICKTTAKVKRALSWLLCFLLAITFVLTSNWTGVINTRFETSNLSEHGMTGNAIVSGGSPSERGFKDFIDESLALQSPPCVDIRSSADPRKSRMYIRGPTQRKLWDRIRVDIALSDGFGRPKTTGGDNLLATINTDELNAHALGVVTDHGNGRYSAEFIALWSGASRLRVFIAYKREMVTYMYRIRTQNLGVTTMFALFQVGNYTDETTCHYNGTWLQTFMNYTDMCNFTYVNSGMPWYCGKPRDKHLLCEDWHYSRPNPARPHMSDCDGALMNRSIEGSEIEQNVTVDIEPYNGTTVAQSPRLQCGRVNRTQLWYKRDTTGFLFNDTWRSRLCQVLDVEQITKCLRGKSLYMIGDSTTRQWFKFIMHTYNCDLTTSEWKETKWHKPAECSNIDLDFKVHWRPHSQPFLAGKRWADSSYTHYSTSLMLDDFGDEDNVIVVIHMYTHVLPFHYSLFRMKLITIRNSVDRLLSRNKRAKILIKMPHTSGIPDDYFGFLFTDIAFNVFKGLHNRVTFLDQKDATLAATSKGHHPKPNIVSAMVNQMFSFACD